MAHGGVAGLLERLATGVNSILSVLVVGRLVLPAYGARGGLGVCLLVGRVLW